MGKKGKKKRRPKGGHPAKRSRPSTPKPTRRSKANPEDLPPYLHLLKGGGEAEVAVDPAPLESRPEYVANMQAWREAGCPPGPR